MTLLGMDGPNAAHQVNVAARRGFRSDQTLGSGTSSGSRGFKFVRAREGMTMAHSLPLPVWNRRLGKLVQECSDDLKATYESQPQRSITQWLKSQPLFDRLLAAYQNTRWSARQIEPFICKHHIDMSEFEPVEYRSFAEFFDRRFRPGVRKFPSAPGEMGAFAEARYLAWDRLDAGQTFPVKGYSLNAEQILGNAQRARPFIGGPILLARLAPVDYHRQQFTTAHQFDAWGLFRRDNKRVRISISAQHLPVIQLHRRANK
jgi:phosphatidylserine decarboxylase